MLDDASQMKQEEITIGKGGMLTFALTAYASVNIRFPDY